MFPLHSESLDKAGRDHFPTPQWGERETLGDSCIMRLLCVRRGFGLDHKIELGYRKRFMVYSPQSLWIGKCDPQVENESDDFIDANLSKIL